MHKRSKIKFAAILLAMAIAAGAFAGCSGNEAKEPEQGGTQEQTTTGEQAAEEPAENTPKTDASAALDESSGLLQFQKPAEDSEVAILETSAGTIKIMLFPQIAPKAVENFVTHAKDGYYDGLTFHRIIDDFMIQGGDPSGNGTGGESIWGKAFEDEFSTELHNFRGALSMANSGANTNGSQFFIIQTPNLQNGLDAQMEAVNEQNPGNFTKEAIDKYKEIGGTPWLDYKHTVFGQVFEGMDVVDKIVKETKVEDANGTVLKENQPVIKSIKIEPASNYFDYSGAVIGESGK